MTFPAVSLCLPDWIERVLPDPEHVFASAEERMQLAIDLARRNVERHGGGPFGAAVFDLADGRLIAPGVNLVTSMSCFAAHAEIMALLVAQRLIGHFSFAAAGRQVALATSTEPCAMCLGALPWAGIHQLTCGAREADARRIGFDEGHKPTDWRQDLERRGIGVQRDVLRPQAVAVLRRYREKGGLIYNGRNG